MADLGHDPPRATHLGRFSDRGWGDSGDRWHCVPTEPHTAPYRRIPSWPRRSRCSPAPSKTRCGRTCAHNKLRSLLREYYPAILAAFAVKRDGILRPEARALLAAAPTPRAAAKLTNTQLRKLLGQAGRQRGIDAEAARLQAVLRAEYLHHPPLVEDAFGKQALALLRQLNVACSNADELAAATVAHFDQHPDAEIITSLPGLGSLTGARVLAEIGDDRSRFADARSLKAFAALTASPGARAHYDRRKTTGDRHTAAQRNLFNRLLGCLHHCLHTRQHYNENIAFPPPRTEAQKAAA